MALDTLGFFSRWEDFRSASLSSPADERAQFPRVGRRGKKLERSTRVCRLRRPCTSDRSGQCQRCRSPPPPSKSSPTYAAPCSTPRDRGSSNRRTGSEDTGGIRVTSGSLMTVLSQQESVTVSRNFVRNFASPLPLLEKLEFSFESWENIFLLKILSSVEDTTYRYYYYCCFIVRISPSRLFSASVINSTRDYIVTENILERELLIL